jgi:hypothetical protein
MTMRFFTGCPDSAHFLTWLLAYPPPNHRRNDNPHGNRGAPKHDLVPKLLTVSAACWVIS